MSNVTPVDGVCWAGKLQSSLASYPQEWYDRR